MAKECEPGAKILLARAAIGNKEVIEELEKREDLIVDDVAIYDTFYENQDLIDEKGQFERGKIDCAVFTSASTGKRLCSCHRGTGLYESSWQPVSENRRRRKRYDTE